MLVHELLDKRKLARQNKDWEMSDIIRDKLDKNFVFVFDTPKGEDVYFELEGMTRDKLIEKINKDKRAEKQFDAWLYSMNSKKV
jgi:hypothetical protein